MSSQNDRRPLHFETLAIHAGSERDPTTGAVVPPLHLSTTYERDVDGAYSRGLIYSRLDNPNRRTFEHRVAALEGGETGLAFASGSAAANALFQALGAGAHVVAADDVYHGTRHLLNGVFAPWGLATTWLNADDPARLPELVEAALRPETALVWVESPSNPLLHIVDIAALARVTRARGVALLVDNTWATPALQRPLGLGADIVLHSASKYLGGHSDILAGVLVFAEGSALAQRTRVIQGQTGGVPSPFECWLAARSLATLPQRVRAHCEGARAVAAMLAEHPRVARVHYPGLADHPGHAVAAAQMSAPGGMLSFEVRGGAAEAFAVVAGVRIFARASSLGGVESLIEHRASIEGPGTKTPENLVRVSVGLEHPADLVADLRGALDALDALA